MECPIPIIEDKPVKVVYMDSVAEFLPANLDVQGQELSPSKKYVVEQDTRSASESIDSDLLDASVDSKSQDENKTKSKHQRKQVFTPVEAPDLELIDPSDLGIDISPKKKRKFDENTTKNLVPKKSYLLNRSTAGDKKDEIHTTTGNIVRESVKNSDTFGSTISAIDNLVKAAELLETQAASKHSTTNEQPNESSINTPVKRGRGRPRKYPLPETGTVSSEPITPQKKTKFTDCKTVNKSTESDYSTDDEIIKENWTMGKINENIVCPICNKLFRSENVVFKHVKHCTGPSPSRSDSDRRSAKRLRQSQDSERKSYDSTSDDTDSEDEKLITTVKNSKTKDSTTKIITDSKEVIVIEDTPKKSEPEEPKQESKQQYESKKDVGKNKAQPKTENLSCEFCGKLFRQLSYLVNHKLQHKTDNLKKSENNKELKTVFCCEVCKKEFRKLHHLVQHRIIHKPNAMLSKMHRKSSNDQSESKVIKTKNDFKQTVDLSAGFRCEPCDKSFRKLHHLVEHRETHGGINKKCAPSTQPTTDSIKSTVMHTCDICKKTFKKLQHLLEHKEQHLDTGSEKSDDKSVKSSLSTKDIIHECSLCYMVFPNEHSLNKHTIICLRKKKQSASKKQVKPEDVKDDEDEKYLDLSEQETGDDVEIIDTVKESIDDKEEVREHVDKNIGNTEVKQTKNIKLRDIDSSSETQIQTDKFLNQNDERKFEIPCPKRVAETDMEKIDVSGEKPAKLKKMEVITIPDTPTPKKKVPVKEKVAPTVTKRKKSLNVERPVLKEQTTESSDDDEVRYMLNPNFKEVEEKHFMKIRANKRSSLQIERPNSKNLIQRRISLQHPPKAPRLKAKPVEKKHAKVDVIKSPKPVVEVALSTDSDDSDVKYSFPENVSTNKSQKEVKNKINRQSLASKRKSISSIAKRKSLGKHKVTNSTQVIRKRTTEAEHRCDCGALFSSAALLARHTSLAHTPPRRRRSPPPAPAPAPAPSKPTTAKPKNEVSNKNIRKSSVGDSDAKSSNTVVKGVSNTKLLRSSMHRGVPVPDKMRKFMEKAKK